MGLVSVEISGELWQEIMTVGWKAGDGRVIECIKGLPEGAIWRSVSYIGPRGSDPMPILVFTFEHPDFKELAKGASIPVIDIVHQKFRG